MQLLPFACLLTAVCCSADPPTVDLIADAKFQQGLIVADSNGKEQVIRWNGSGTPVWTTAQHHSKSSLADVSKRAFHTGGFSFQDDYESLAVHPRDSDADVVLGVNAMHEYGGVYRKKGDPWPHLYVSQRISNPRGHLGDASPSLAEMERLDLNLQVRLLYDRPNRGPEYNRRLHAAQFLLFFTVQNLNRKSKGFGDYYWFGIALYDSRQEVTSFSAMQDKGSPKKKGTDKLIYDIGVAPFTSEVVGRGDWVPIRGDILPHLRAGLQESWKRGFLPGSNDMGDYKIGGLVLGWEVTGLNDAAAAVKDLSAVATLKAR